MKKILLFILLSVPLLCLAQGQTYFTPGVPPGSTGFTPTFRVKAGVSDSLPHIYIANGNKTYETLTAREIYSYVAAHGTSIDTTRILFKTGYTSQTINGSIRPDAISLQGGSSIVFDGNDMQIYDDHLITDNIQYFGDSGHGSHIIKTLSNVLTADRTQYYSDKDGTFAMLDDIPDSTHFISINPSTLELNPVSGNRIYFGGSSFLDVSSGMINGADRVSAALPPINPTDVLRLSDTTLYIKAARDTGFLKTTGTQNVYSKLHFYHPSGVSNVFHNASGIRFNNQTDVDGMIIGNTNNSASLGYSGLEIYGGVIDTGFLFQKGGVIRRLNGGGSYGTVLWDTDTLSMNNRLNTLALADTGFVDKFSFQSIHGYKTFNTIFMNQVFGGTFNAMTFLTGSVLEFDNPGGNAVGTAQINQATGFGPDGSAQGLSVFVGGAGSGGNYFFTDDGRIIKSVSGVNYNVIFANDTTGMHGGGAGITALTGDGTATGPGSAAFTLATVNSNVGSFGDASHTVSVTANAKGLGTAYSANVIAITQSQVAHLPDSLTSKIDISRANARYYPLGSNPAGYLTSVTPYTAGYSINIASFVVKVDSTVSKSKASALADYNILITALSGKQATLVNTTNLKSVNSISLLGSGNLAITPSNTDTTITGFATRLLLNNYSTKAFNVSTYQPLLGFTAENVANKAAGFGTLNNTLYPTTQAVETEITGKGYITANQTITFTPTGDVTGTTNGTTTLNPALIIGAGKVTNTMIAASTIDLTAKVTGLLPDGNISSAATWNAKESALTFSTGLTRSTNIITVNTSQNISTLSNLTSNNGILYTNGSGVISQIAALDSAYIHYNSSTHLPEAIKPTQYINGTDFSGGATSASDTLTIKFSGIWRMFAAGTGTSYSNGKFSVNAAQAITSLSTLTSNGIVNTSGGVGTLGVTGTSGSGNVVLVTGATLITPTLGAATLTSANKVAITAPATSATLTIANGATLQQTGAFTLNLTTTANSTPTFPTGSGTLVYIAGTNSWTNLQTFSNGISIALAKPFGIVEGTSGKTGQTTLVAGTKAITVTGTTTSSRAIVTLVTPGSTSLTASYQAVCTANTLTIQANVAAGTINVSDTSTLNYLIIN